MAKKRNRKIDFSEDKVASVQLIKTKLLRYFQASPTQAYNPKQLASFLRLKGTANKVLISKALEELTSEKLLRKVGRHRYRYNFVGKRYEGIFHGKANGRNYVTVEENDKFIQVDSAFSNRALDGDKVLVQMLPKKKYREDESWGEVVSILERGENVYVGVLEKVKGTSLSFVIPDGNRIENDIFIPEKNVNGAKHGQKVVVHVEEWVPGDKNPLGKIIGILGEKGDNDAEMHAILVEFGLPYKYPEEVEEAANKLPEKLSSEEMKGRKDFTDLLTFTIDPADAKDFDDALSFTKLSNGNLQVGVHIADVTAYVKPGDIIDNEARERATSIYLVDRTIPMLPERLCNDLCSLKPNVDRPAFSVLFELTPKAEIVYYTLTKSMIHSDKRLTYEQALEVIEDKATISKEIDEAIRGLNDLARQLRKRRFNDGALNFERSEVRFVLADDGNPIAVEKVEPNEANWLIEEFMLLANRTVAEHIALDEKKSKKTKPFIYRVHDLPDEEKLKDLAEFMMQFKYRFNYEGSPQKIAKELNKLLSSFRGKPEQNMLETIVIRSMAKAIYTTDNVGHYGLGFSYYTHFTSPIRRYPDMLVHRLLVAYAAGEKAESKGKLESLAKHCSSQEQIATNAERESIKYKQVEFMQDKVGETFNGFITGVTSFGLFVEIEENGCEGLVSMYDLDDDFYYFDEKNYRLVGQSNGKVYNLGDELRVTVTRADLDKKQLDFMLASENEQQIEKK